MSAEATTDASGTAKRVLVTGASGRTGGIVFEKLLAKEGYATKGMVRSEQVGGPFFFFFCTIQRDRSVHCCFQDGPCYSSSPDLWVISYEPSLRWLEGWPLPRSKD